MAKELQLLVVAGVDAGKLHIVSEEGATLGRSRSANICIRDEALSRHHCRITVVPAPTVQDLMSSNGTLLNGISVNTQPTTLANGDIITIGSTVLRVSLVEEPAPVQQVQPERTVEKTVVIAPNPIKTEIVTPVPSPAEGESVGQLFKSEEDVGQGKEVDQAPTLFTETEQSASLTNNVNKRRLLITALASLFVVLLSSLLFVTMNDQQKETKPAPRTVVKAEPQAEFQYERFVVDAKHLFWYQLSYDVTSNVMSLDVTDLGEADRSFKKHVVLTERAKAALMKLLWGINVTGINEIFPESSIDGVSIERRKLTLVRGMEVWTRVAENVIHERFNAICEKLEFFARNELNVWAAEYSVVELEAMAADQLSIATRYWEQKDLGDDKVWLAVDAYRKGVSALETLNPKPATITPLTQGLQQAEALLKERYESVLFEVEQAMNTKRYEVASEKLRQILRMIPDRDDSRNQLASEKLLMVERRREKTGGR